MLQGASGIIKTVKNVQILSLESVRKKCHALAVSTGVRYAPVL